MGDRNPVTPEGFEALKEELKRLKSVERPKNVRDLEEARAHGDLSENAEYHAAKERQGMLAAKMADLEARISTAEVIDPKTLSGTKVLFGATVSLQDVDSGETKVYQIVGDYEANLEKGMISINSPIARGLIGKQLDDEVTVRTPAGSRNFEIIGVKFE